jgi:hypothetical protein
MFIGCGRGAATNSAAAGLAGNLAGNLQNPAEFKPFRMPARLIAPQYQEVGVNSLSPETQGTSAKNQGIGSKDIGASTWGARTFGARARVQGHWVPVGRTVISSMRFRPCEKRL